MKSLVVVLALLLASCSSGSHHTAARPTTTTVPSTVQPTTTTTPTNVNVAALVGVWDPVSITGYNGPLTSPPLHLTPLLGFGGNGRWTGSDGCNNLGGSYELSNNGTLHLGEQFPTSRCGPDRMVPIPGTVTRVEWSHDGRLTFFADDGPALASYERASVTARIVLPSRTMTAGSSVIGHVIVENTTGRALHVGGCISLFQVVLGNDKLRQETPFPECGQRLTIPLGASSYPVPVQATYLACSDTGHAQGAIPVCVPNSGHLPPLPPGEYEATLFQSSNVVPTPPPIAVQVTTQRSAP